MVPIRSRTKAIDVRNASRLAFSVVLIPLPTTFPGTWQGYCHHYGGKLLTLCGILMTLSKKIRGMDVNTEDKLISFDVKSLFTKVPIDLSLQIIRRRLAQDPNLEQRTPLDVSTIADLTELCLRTTYFLYSDEFFEQKEGAAMGSPLSPVVANIFMEEFEIEAETAPF